MTRKNFITRYTAFVRFVMKLAQEAKRCGIESLEQEVEDIEETEKVFKEGLRIIFSVPEPAAIANEILTNMIAHEKNKYKRLYMTIQKRAVLGLLAGEGSYILHKVLMSLADLTPKETRKIEMLFLWEEPEPEPDTAEEDDTPLTPFDETILALEDTAIKTIVEEFEANVLAFSLKPAPKKVRQRFYNHMSKRQAAMLKEDIEYIGIFRSEEARQQILAFIEKTTQTKDGNAKIAATEII